MSLYQFDANTRHNRRSASIFRKNSDCSVWEGEVNFCKNESTKAEMMIRDDKREWCKNTVLDVVFPITLSFVAPKASASVARNFSVK